MWCLIILLTVGLYKILGTKLQMRKWSTTGTPDRPNPPRKSGITETDVLDRGITRRVHVKHKITRVESLPRLKLEWKDCPGNPLTLIEFYETFLFWIFIPLRWGILNGTIIMSYSTTRDRPRFQWPSRSLFVSSKVLDLSLLRSRCIRLSNLFYKG